MLGGIGLLLNIAGARKRALQVVRNTRVDSEPQIVIGAGGTAGHVVPALAVADALRAEGAEVTFIGGDRAEVELVPPPATSCVACACAAAARAPGQGAAERGLIARRCGSPGPWRAARAAPGRGPRWRRLRGRTGGLSAIVSRVPLVLTEADSHLGLTNRLLAPFARRVCLAFPLEGRDGARYRVTGRPVPPPRDRLAGGAGAVRDRRWRTCVLVFGGSQGARSINHAARRGVRRRALPRPARRRRARSALTCDAPGPHYDLRGYIPRFGEALLAADLVVARAGGSIFEIAAHGKPAVLIPYPHATADHQTTNARYMERAGAAVVIPDES